MMADDGAATSCEWELVNTSGRGPGRISHHTTQVRPSKEVIFYGGLKGEDNNDEIYLFNPNTNAWLTVNRNAVSDRYIASISLACDSNNKETYHHAVTTN